MSLASNSIAGIVTCFLNRTTFLQFIECLPNRMANDDTSFNLRCMSYRVQPLKLTNGQNYRECLCLDMYVWWSRHAYHLVCQLSTEYNRR